MKRMVLVGLVVSACSGEPLQGASNQVFVGVSPGGQKAVQERPARIELRLGSAIEFERPVAQVLTSATISGPGIDGGAPLTAIATQEDETFAMYRYQWFETPELVAGTYVMEFHLANWGVVFTPESTCTGIDGGVTATFTYAP